MIRLADLSVDGLYRYSLRRIWEPDGPRMAWIMLNPSIADAEIDDPTIRRCIGFAQREGCGSIEVVNLYAYRATKPDDLLDATGAGIDVLGPENVPYVTAAFEHAAVVIAGWGASFVDRRNTWKLARVNVQGIAAKHDRPLHCLGRTKAGHPRHPLYVRADQPLEVFSA